MSSKLQIQVISTVGAIIVAALGLLGTDTGKDLVRTLVGPRPSSPAPVDTLKRRIERVDNASKKKSVQTARQAAGVAVEFDRCYDGAQHTVECSLLLTATDSVNASINLKDARLYYHPGAPVEATKLNFSGRWQADFPLLLRPHIPKAIIYSFPASVAGDEGAASLSIHVPYTFGGPKPPRVGQEEADSTFHGIVIASH